MKKILTFLCVMLLVAAMSIQVQAQAIDFNSPVKVFKAHTYIQVIRSADLDGDHIIDLIVGGGDTIYVLKGNGDGTFINSWKAKVGSYYNLSIADLTNDGKPDLVFPVSVNYVGFLVNNGSGGFSALKSYTLGGDSNEIAVADFDHDGYLDVVAATEHDLDPHYRYIAVFINNKNGTLKNRVLYSVPYVPYDQEPTVYGNHVNTLDMNDDGYSDVVQPFESKDSMLIYYNKGDGTFNAPISVYIPYRVTTTQVEDMDHDGKQDLIVLGENNPTVFHPDYTFGFYLQKSGNADQNIIRTYANPYGYSGGQLYGRNVVEDMNQDGEYDLTITPSFYDETTSSFFDSLIIYSNSGNLTFGTQPPAYGRLMEEEFYGLIADHLNGDQLPDYAYITDLDSTVSILLQKNLVTAISSSSSMETTVIYPNPSSGLLNIHASAGQVIQAVSVYDAMGRKVFSQHSEAATENISLDLNSLPKGLYLLEEEKESGATNIQHFVLQ